MIELPEALALAKQINDVLVGKKIKNAIRGFTPHKFLFPMDEHNLPEHQYQGASVQLGQENKGEFFTNRLKGKTIQRSWGNGNIIFIQIDDDYTLTLGCGGQKIIYHENDRNLPKKHQLFIEFEDGTYFTVTISGWGEVRLFESKFIDQHPHVCYDKLDPLSKEFTFEKFDELIDALPENSKCGAKYFFITKPGLRGIGNGVIQDIFFLAKIHPARKMKTLSKEERRTLYDTTRKELNEMAIKRGRSTEKDLFDNDGGYQTKLYSKTAGTPCPNCATIIEKKAYLGGSIYFCPKCQKVG